jgi:hypothetical protein
MEDLRNVMRIIDENATKLPEGDYLEICNRLQSIFKDKESKEMSPLFDYENFNFFVESIPDMALDYFYDHYYTESIENDIDFLNVQKSYLEDEIKEHKPFKRVTAYTKQKAILHYCWMHNMTLERYTPECLKQYLDERGYDLGDVGENFNVALKRMYRSYLVVENRYRELYRESMYRKINKLNGWIENFGDM